MLPTTEPSRRPLLVFLSIAFALHAAALWLLEVPDNPAGSSSRTPALRVAIESAPTGDFGDAKPGKVVLPADMRPRKSRERSVASPGDHGRRPAVAEKDRGGDAIPGVDPLELLRDLTPADKAPTTRFGEQPETHPLFKRQRLVRAEEPAAAWSHGIWRRSAVTGEKRFQAVDGSSVWIRRYDNGDIQLCERARDDLMDQWDDHLPFVCER